MKGRANSTHKAIRRQPKVGDTLSKRQSATRSRIRTQADFALWTTWRSVHMVLINRKLLITYTTLRTVGNAHFSTAMSTNLQRSVSRISFTPELLTSSTETSLMCLVLQLVSAHLISFDNLFLMLLLVAGCKAARV